MSPYSLSLVGGILFALSSQAQTISYDVSTISQPIKEKASVITQQNLQRYVVEDLEKVTYTIRRIYTIVREEEENAHVVGFPSTRYYNLDEVDIKAYDKLGKQVSRYKKKDMMMQATGEGLVEEGVYYYLGIPILSYPFTIEEELVYKIKGTLTVPFFQIASPGESIVESVFEAVVPVDLGLRYKAKNIHLQAVERDLGKSKSYTWTVKNLPPFEYEEGAVKAMDRYPAVDIVLNKFSHYGNNGDLSSWNQFGTWIGNLYQGLDVLPEDRAQFFRDLVKEAKTDRDKARIIYKYLQDNFRYVSIQLGIGGLKPFSATFTDQKKYGDCKGLSNYMKAALSIVGVRSHVAIINSEYNAKPVDPNFPANDFDHVILCIPQKGDSIWLECTSNTAEFGTLGTFTENRNALLVTENGGVLVPTPRSKASNNQIIFHNQINLQEDGSGWVTSLLSTKGDYKNQFGELLRVKRDDQKQGIVYWLEYKQPDDFVIAAREEDIEIKLAYSKLPEFSAGNKVFFTPRPYKLWSRVLPKAENRKLDFYFRQPFIQVDTTVIQLPDGFALDVLPQPRKFENKYVHYQSNYWWDANTRSIYSVVELSLHEHQIPAADYPQVKQFFEDVLKEEKQRIVVKK